MVQTMVSDDSYMVVRPAPVLGQQESPVTVRFATEAPTFIPASITFTLEAKVTTASLVQRIDLFDWVAGSWVEIDARPATVVDQVVNVPVTNPARFVEPITRSMQAQVRLKASGPTPMTWAGRIDRVAWTVR